MADNIHTGLPDDENVLERETAFSASAETLIDEENNDSSFGVPEKDDVYFTDLLEEEEAQAAAEAEAEEQLRLKREKDKDAARKKDAKAFKDSRDHYEAGMERKNAERARQEDERRRQEAFVRFQQQQSASVPVAPATHEPFFGSTADNATSVDTNVSDRQSGTSDSYKAYIEAQRASQQAEEIRTAEQQAQRARSDAFFEQANQNARDRQQLSENYKSFGNQGIDYSGNNQHTAYNETAVTSPKTSFITETDYAALRSTYESCREQFKTYGDQVPPAVATQYQEAVDRFFDVQRKIDQGQLTVSRAPAYETPVYTGPSSTEPLEKPNRQQFGFDESSSRPASQSSQFTPSFNRDHYPQRGPTPGAFSDTASRADYPGADVFRRLAAQQAASTYLSQPHSTTEPVSTTSSNTTSDCSMPRSVIRTRMEGLQQPQSGTQTVFPSSKGKALNPNNRSSEIPAAGSSFAQGTQAFYDRSRANDIPGSKRVGDSHIKPVGTPLQSSPINKYAKLKIYDSSNYAKPFEVATQRTLNALGGAVVMAARLEQTGSANMVLAGRERAREANLAIQAAKDTPRQIAAAYQTAAGAVLAARNVGRLLQGKETISFSRDKGLTIKQIDRQLRNPFTSSEQATMQKKFGDKVYASDSALRTKKVLQTASNKNLKNEIKALQAKGSALTAAERSKLKALMDEKKLADRSLRKTHGLQKARADAAGRNKKIDFLSAKAMDKTVKKAGRGKLRLSKKDAVLVSRMKERISLLEKRQKLEKAKAARRGLISSLGGILEKATRESEESAVQSVATASRFAQNRYVRSILKYTRKAALGVTAPVRKAAKAGLKALDNKLGVSAGVKKTTSKAAETATRKILHSRPYKAINGGLANRARAKISDKTPQKIKSAVKKGVSQLNKFNSKKNAALNKLKQLKKKFKNSKLGKVFASVGKGFKGISAAFKAVKKFVIKIALIGGAFLIVVALIGAMLTSAGGLVSSVMFWDDADEDGKINVTTLVTALNNEQEKINNTVQAHRDNTEANGGKYNRVYVDYIGANNNQKEIMSMAAVYFDQDLSNKSTVTEYALNLFKASNYVTTSESDLYYCSGCEEREYKCYDDYDEFATAARIARYQESNHSLEPDVGNPLGCTISDFYFCTEPGHEIYNNFGCYFHNNYEASNGMCDNYEAYLVDYDGENFVYDYYCLGHCYGQHYDYFCPGHTEKICRGHIDLYVNVTCMGFDSIFSADPIDISSKDYGKYVQGELLGTFNITYYCAEKYPHICNAGPPYKTASGTVVTAGRTIAVDASVIPLGTPVIINGHLYVAEDTGGAIKGNRIDIAVETHQEALNMGRDVFRVYSAVEASEESQPNVQRSTVDYISLANEATQTGAYMTQQGALELFGAAKDPVIPWRLVAAERDYDTAETYQKKLQAYDANHVGTLYSNAELNTFEYVKMDISVLKNLCSERGIGIGSESSAYSIIRNYLIPYDKKHPSVYVNEPGNSGENGEPNLYFAGWTEENKEWAKTIYENMNSEVYKGLDKIKGGGGTNYSSVSPEDLIIKGSKIDTVYYSQHDSRWGNKPIRADSPANTISKAGCGFTSMSIVVSSLTSHTVDPVAMCAKYGKTHYAIGQGAYHSLISDVSKDYGLSCTELLKTDMQGVVNALNKGKLVVALVGRGGYGWTGAGYYQGNGHFLVICGVLEDGSLLLADPNRPDVAKSGQSISLDYFIASGVKKFWSIGK